MLVILNLPLIGMWVRLLTVPYAYMYPAILVFCGIGAFSLGNSTFDLWLLVLFGVAGYVFAKLECEPAPMLLGLILGPMMEENFRRAMTLARGNFGTFVDRPISLSLLVVALIALIVVVLPGFRRTREQAFQEEK
jgi:TctA family transporter